MGSKNSDRTSKLIEEFEKQLLKLEDKDEVLDKRTEAYILGKISGIRFIIGEKNG